MKQLTCLCLVLILKIYLECSEFLQTKQKSVQKLDSLLEMWFGLKKLSVVHSEFMIRKCHNFFHQIINIIIKKN